MVGEWLELERMTPRDGDGSDTGFSPCDDDEGLSGVYTIVVRVANTRHRCDALAMEIEWPRGPAFEE
jgi:hypothetical protein